VSGWAAQRGGGTSGSSRLRCFILFLWTPHHFWALALNRTDDTRVPACRCCRFVADALNNDARSDDSRRLLLVLAR